jgi:DNA repair exonuclease SbcCD nuclease subunit
MTKIALIADTHFGVRGNNDNFHDNMEVFYSQVFFPYLKQHKIKSIVHLGDVFDNRRTIDIKTAKRAREYFFEPLQEAGIKMDVIAGNHDLYKKETSDVSTLGEFVKKAYTNIRIFHDTTEIDNVLYVPWINRENRERTMKAIDQTDCEFVFGHLELTGVNYSRVQVATHGDDPNIFSKFNHVFSGHYHYRNTLGNITYLGSPTEHTWIDAGTKRGFHIFDTSTGEIEFIENPYNIFEYISYPFTGNLDEYDFKKHIRITADIDKQSDFDKFKRELEHRGALTVTIITPKSKVIESASIEVPDEINVTDSIAFMREAVENDDEYKVLVDLYNRANELKV